MLKKFFLGYIKTSNVVLPIVMAGGCVWLFFKVDKLLGIMGMLVLIFKEFLFSQWKAKKNESNQP